MAVETVDSDWAEPTIDGEGGDPTGVESRRYEEVLLVGTFGGGGIHQYIESIRDEFGEDVDVSMYDMFTSNGQGVRWFLHSFALSIWAAIRFPFRSRPDVVHVHASQSFSFYRASFYVLVAAHLWRRPVVFHVHGSSFDEFVDTRSTAIRTLQSIVFRSCDRVIALSEYWRDVLRRRVTDRKLTVVPNAVDPGEYEPDFDAEPPRVVFVSHLEERKGIPELVEAIDRLAEEDALDFDVSIAGRGPLAPAVESLSDRHERVSYRGYVSEAEKREMLEEGSIYVLPSRAEGLPIAMLEGMAAGNAVVSTNVGGIPEVLEEGGGTVIEPGDEEALREALTDLVESPSAVEEMARRNRKLVRERYGWDVVTDEVLDVYDEAWDHRQPPAARGRGTPSVD